MFDFTMVGLLPVVDGAVVVYNDGYMQATDNIVVTDDVEASGRLVVIDVVEDVGNLAVVEIDDEEAAATL